MSWNRITRPQYVVHWLPYAPYTSNFAKIVKSDIRAGHIDLSGRAKFAFISFPP